MQASLRMLHCTNLPASSHLSAIKCNTFPPIGLFRQALRGRPLLDSEWTELMELIDAPSPELPWLLCDAEEDRLAAEWTGGVVWGQSLGSVTLFTAIVMFSRLKPAISDAEMI